jgi:hypothetical protein
LQLQPFDDKAVCSICDERAEEAMYKCSACKTCVHGRCAPQTCLVCPAAFHPEQIRAAFVRCFASLLYTYKKFLQPSTGEQKKAGLTYHFSMDSFLRSLPSEHAEYMAVLQQTQGIFMFPISSYLAQVVLTIIIGFNEFISDRERAKPGSKDPRIILFDEIILSKRNRGRSSLFSGRMTTNFLSDTSDHLWRPAVATSFPPSSRGHQNLSEDYREVVTRGRPDIWIVFISVAPSSLGPVNGTCCF